MRSTNKVHYLINKHIVLHFRENKREKQLLLHFFIVLHAMSIIYPHYISKGKKGENASVLRRLAMKTQGLCLLIIMHRPQKEKSFFQGKINMVLSTHQLNHDSQLHKINNDLDIIFIFFSQQIQIHLIKHLQKIFYPDATS